MNDSGFSKFVPPPIAPPTEAPLRQYGQADSHQPGWLVTAFGHALWFGFLGQIAFTLSLFVIPSGSPGAVNHTFLPAEHWLCLVLCLPGLGAFGGLALSAWKPLGELASSFRIVLTILGIGALGVLDLIGLVLWSWHGYC